MNVAYLTPMFRQAGKMTGYVHSQFDKVVNLVFKMSNGMERLLTLVDETLPRLPDSIAVAKEQLSIIRSRQPAVWTGNVVCAGTHSWRITVSDWTGAISVYSKPPLIEEFLRIYKSMAQPDGFSRYSQTQCSAKDVLVRLVAALKMGSTEEACSAAMGCIGWGAGLTPSADDAIMGMLAVFAGAGRRVPSFMNETILARTTDVSAKYLRCASEGYFSQLLCELVDGMFDADDIQRRAEAVARIGATSGMDMLYGAVIACRILSL